MNQVTDKRPKSLHLEKRLNLRRHFVFAFALASILHSGESALAQTPAKVGRTDSATFRFHIPTEPQSLDPARLTSTDANYFFNSIARGLYSYSNVEGLVPEGAKRCSFENPLRMVCELNHEMKWSDGTKVEAADYVRTFRRLMQSAKNPSIELLKNIKFAEEVNRGAQNAEKLGVKADTPDRLVFEFSLHDPDFLFKLTHSVLVPTKLDVYPKRGEVKDLVFNGPYRITSWVTGQRLRLEPNSFYKRGNSKRPPVEILFVDDDQTALHLYEEKTLTFLRRLSTTYIPVYRSRKDFVQIPVARFDYVGFGEELQHEPHLRSALSYSADFKELKQIYDALGLPGCPSLPEEFLDRSRCVSFDLARAKKELALVPAEIRAKRFKIVFSKLGGDDIKKGMEWFQAQWKKNLGLQVELEQMEQGVYLARLREQAPAIFRKGVGLERPTCLAALETFAKNGAENFLKLSDPAFEKIISRLSLLPFSKIPTKESKSLCGEGVQYLLDRHLLIPLGRIHFTMLADPAFKGWDLNEMNQLDLSGLSYTRP